MTKQTVTATEPEVINQIGFGYIQTNTNVDKSVPTANLGQLALLGTAIDSCIFTYNQICANFYMSNYFRSNYGENPTITIPSGQYIHANDMATYGELWKINLKLQDTFREFYQYLDDSITVRVYNEEPIIINTPSRCGYVVVHPSIQSDLKRGSDEYGAYFEANVGGLDDPNVLVSGQYLQTRRLVGRRGYAPRLL